MEKSKKYIYIILALILVGVLASSATFALMKHNDTLEKESDKPTGDEQTSKKDGVRFLKASLLNDEII